MSVTPNNLVLYLGQDQHFANSVKKILNYEQDKFNLDFASDFQDVQHAIQNKSISIFLVDSNFLNETDSSVLDRILKFSKNIPVVMIVDKEQEKLGQYAIKNGAYDYVVRTNGALTSIPFAVNQALKYAEKPGTIKFDFKTESDLEETIVFFEMNESGRFLTVDENLSEVLGLPRENYYQSYLVDFIAEEDREKFYQWRASPKKRQKNFLIQTEVIHREKGVIPVELQLEPFAKPDALISGFRGYLRILEDKSKYKIEKEENEILPLFRAVYRLNGYLSKGLKQLFLMKLVEIPHSFFHFSRAMLFLYSPVKNRYYRELMVGEEIKKEQTDLKSDVFQQSEIDHLFPNGEFIRFVHQSVLNDREREELHGSFHSDIFAEKQWQPGEEWCFGDRMFINLKNSQGATLGFVLLEEPAINKIPDFRILKQAELFAIFASSLYEAQTRFEDVEDKYRQFKQIFTILEAYSIDLPLEGLIREIVWAIRHSLGFNLSILGILSKKTSRLHLKAVAAEGKEKTHVLEKVNFSLEEVKSWLKEKYRISHSYLVTEKISSFYLLKRIYGLPLLSLRENNHWNYNNVLVIPIRTNNQNIIGFFILDDPVDKQKPNQEVVQILEKIARIVAITVENKLIYTNMISKYNMVQSELDEMKGQGNSNRIKQIFRRINSQR